MRKYFSIIFWGLFVLVLSLVLQSTAKNYASSLFLSLALIPGIILAKVFLKQISFKDIWNGILNSIYLAAITLLTEYLVILSVDQYLFSLGLKYEANIIFNPFFLWFLIISCLSLEKYIMHIIPGKSDEKIDRVIDFISERKKVSLRESSIMYVESRDNEVWIRCDTGVSYRTKMNISHWEEVLDSGFIRIHRSFLVNIDHITKFSPTKVWVEDISLEVSRKYKESVIDTLSVKNLSL